MSRLFLGSVLTAALVAGVAIAADPSSTGLKDGDPIGAFYVTKVAGAEQDGVENGQELCYRCKYGQRPMVMVFTRTDNEKVAQLIKDLDKAVDKHDDDQLKAFVTVMGKDQATLKSTAKKLAESTKAKQVPVAVANDNPNGPANYRLDPKSDVTVIVANESQVVASHKFDADKVDSAAVLKAVEKMLQ